MSRRPRRSLTRTIVINYADASCGGWCVTISYPGGQGATRVIEISTGPLAGLLRAGLSQKSIDSLFPGTGQPATSYFNPTLAGSVLFPDGRSYGFQYDSYGELARVNLPTGGAVEYDYGDGQDGSGSGFVGSASDSNPVMIYRRLQVRREYAAGGSSASSTTKYSVSYTTDTTEIETTFDSQGKAVTQSEHVMYGAPTDALSLNGTGCNAWNEGLEYSTFLGGAPGSQYFTAPLSKFHGYAAQSGCMSNPQLVSEVTILTANNQQSRVAYSYDQYNNVVDEKEYDWGIGSGGALVRETKTVYLYQSSPSYNSASVNLVRLPLYATVFNGGGTQMAQTVWHYDEFGLQDEAGVAGHDAGYGTGYTLRGNVTSTWRWLNTTNSFLLSAALHYDVAGNVVQAENANGYTSSFGYSDANESYAHATSVTNAAGQTSTQQYDFDSGNLVASVDANNQATSYSYDAADRLVQTTLPNSGHIYQSYPNANTLVVQQDQSRSVDRALQWQAVADGLGRPARQDRWISASGYVETTTGYDAAGRVSVTTNPSGTGLNYATRTSYDALGRVTQVQTADGAAVTYAYNANQVLVTDAAGKKKQYSYDGLGRLTNVLEDPGGLKLTTDYQYDVLDNLTLVSQGTCPNCQQRHFSYDSAGRLLSAQNPESGTVNYSWDAAGNVLSRVDGRNISSSYSYDALNRLTSVSYSDGTPAVTYSFDSGCASNCVGRLVSVSNSNATLSLGSYDAMGNVLASAQVMGGGGNRYGFQYGYNLAGELISESYPSGRSVGMQYDSAGRPVAVSGTQGGQSKTYVSATWTLQGMPQGLFYGNNVVPVYSYNSRLQLSQVYSTVGNNPNNYLQVLSYNWGGSSNNGTLQSAY